MAERLSESQLRSHPGCVQLTWQVSPRLISMLSETVLDQARNYTSIKTITNHLQISRESTHMENFTEVNFQNFNSRRRDCKGVGLRMRSQCCQKEPRAPQCACRGAGLSAWTSVPLSGWKQFLVPVLVQPLISVL